MTSLNSKPFRFLQLVTALIFAALFISGCSSSSNSAAVGSDTTNGTTGDVVASDMTGETTSNTTTGSTTESTAVVPDPLAQNTTVVSFDITVPVYVSDSLQVRVVWGDKDILAMWVSDERWTVVDDFPTDTQKPLFITFSDNDGAVTLGSFETDFKTGTNDSQLLQVTADQFNTNKWDSDGDGVSNLSESIAGTNSLSDDPLTPLEVSLELVPDKTFRISWTPSTSATFYRVLENADGRSGFTQISDDLESSIQTYDHRVALYQRFNASYIVQACNANGCVDSDEQVVTGSLENAIGFLTAGNTEYLDFFGAKVSLSADGNTLAVGAALEDSAASGINGDQADNSADEAGAVYVFVHSNGSWQEQGYLKADNSEAGDLFGFDVSLSADGNTLAVGARGESFSGGAVYIFERSNGDWRQADYLKASYRVSNNVFGSSVSFSADGNTLAVGAPYDDGRGTGVNSDQSFSFSTARSGAVYIFVRSGEVWQQQAYLKADIAGENLWFGTDTSLSNDGNTLAVSRAGGVHLFVRTQRVWQQQQFLDPSVLGAHGTLGTPVSLSADGNTLVATAIGDTSAATGINGDPFEGFARAAGAVYVFVRNNEVWQQQAYIKASNTDANDRFGNSSALSADGNTLAIGANEKSAAKGINGDQSDNSLRISGAVYLFTRENGTWQQDAYLKSTGEGVLNFPEVSLSAMGDTLAVGVGNDRGGSGGAVYFY